MSSERLIFSVKNYFIEGWIFFFIYKKNILLTLKTIQNSTTVCWTWCFQCWAYRKLIIRVAQVFVTSLLDQYPFHPWILALILCSTLVSFHWVFIPAPSLCWQCLLYSFFFFGRDFHLNENLLCTHSLPSENSSAFVTTLHLSA